MMPGHGLPYPRHHTAHNDLPTLPTMSSPLHPIRPEHITGLVLAGGQGSRMGGADKGLQLLANQPLALHCAQRLQPQVGQVTINANRHLNAYQALGYPVVQDLQLPDAEAYPGPMAGFAAGLAACQTPWLLTVACDTPHFPLDLAQRLTQAAVANNSHIAMACSPAIDAHGNRPLPQPTFCLIHASLADSARQFLTDGGRKIRQWASSHVPCMVLFDEPQAFYNANTPEDLAWLQADAQVTRL